jgi:hypothetical protein
LISLIFRCSPKIADARLPKSKNRAAPPDGLRRHLHVIMMTPNLADCKDGGQVQIVVGSKAAAAIAAQLPG